MRIAAILLIWCGLHLQTTQQAQAYSDAALIDGFNKTVFGSEYAELLSSQYVRKFDGPVRFFIRSLSGESASRKVNTFISSLPNLIDNLPVKIVGRPEKANFIIHIVPQRRYVKTVRQDVYKDVNAAVRGLCMVRSQFSRDGIERSDAVIVADQGPKLFSRCMTEEILQGLGPLNDDRTLSASMFNDTSPFTSFRRFDRFILNMLYDPRIENGASQSEVQNLLPAVLRRARKRIEGTN